jgi:hypothetical protein
MEQFEYSKAKSIRAVDLSLANNHRIPRHKCL